MLDTGADTSYMAKELINKMDLSYTNEKAYVNRVIARSFPIKGIAWGAIIQVDQ